MICTLENNDTYIITKRHIDREMPWERESNNAKEIERAKEKEKAKN